MGAERKRQWYLRNRERILKEHKEYREKNRARINDQVARLCRENRHRYRVKKYEWEARNKDAVREYKQKYADAHPEIARINSATRRARRLKATPKWLTLAQRKETRKIYRECPPGHHVDHIVPLKGENVCGLHVPWNLQYLPADANRKKGNKYGED